MYGARSAGHAGLAATGVSGVAIAGWVVTSVTLLMIGITLLALARRGRRTRP